MAAAQTEWTKQNEPGIGELSGNIKCPRWRIVNVAIALFCFSCGLLFVIVSLVAGLGTGDQCDVWDANAILAILVAVELVCYMVGVSRWSTTIGKRMIGTDVLQTDGSKVGLLGRRLDVLHMDHRACCCTAAWSWSPSVTTSTRCTI